MIHARGALPQIRGKIERWHQSLENCILPENHCLPGDLEAQTEAFVGHNDQKRYHQCLSNISPADAGFGRAPAIIKQRERTKNKSSNAGACNTAGLPLNINKPDGANAPLICAAVRAKSSDDGQFQLMQPTALAAVAGGFVLKFPGLLIETFHPAMRYCDYGTETTPSETGSSYYGRPGDQGSGNRRRQGTRRRHNLEHAAAPRHFCGRACCLGHIHDHCCIYRLCLSEGCAHICRLVLLSLVIGNRAPVFFFLHHRRIGALCGKADAILLYCRDHPCRNIVMVIRMRAAVGLDKLYAVALYRIDGAKVNTIGADDFHMLPNLI